MEHEVAHALEPQARIKIDGTPIGRTDVQPGEQSGAAVMSRKVADDVGREPFASVVGVRADGAHLRVARKKQALSAHGDELVARAHTEK